MSSPTILARAILADLIQCYQKIKFIKFEHKQYRMSEGVIVLVYYRVRGKLQPIRNLLAYLGQPFVEVHWGDEQQNRSLPQHVKDTLRSIRVDKASLPLLVFEEMVLYDLYPILAYLCRRFKREDLLGRDIRQRTRLQEILEIYLARQPSFMTEMLRLGDACADKDDDAVMRQKKASLEKLMTDSGYLKEICVYLERQKNPEAFILGTLTVLDFLFLETCHDMLGLFHNIDERRRCPINRLKELFSCKPEELPEEIKHLDTIRAFVAFVTQLPFYENNREYLQSFSIICSSFSPQRAQGLRKIWAYNRAFVR